MSRVYVLLLSCMSPQYFPGLFYIFTPTFCLSTTNKFTWSRNQYFCLESWIQSWMHGQNEIWKTVRSFRFIRIQVRILIHISSEFWKHIQAAWLINKSTGSSKKLRSLVYILLELWEDPWNDSLTLEDFTKIHCIHRIFNSLEFF